MSVHCAHCAQLTAQELVSTNKTRSKSRTRSSSLRTSRSPGAVWSMQPCTKKAETYHHHQACRDRLLVRGLTQARPGQPILGRRPNWVASTDGPVEASCRHALEERILKRREARSMQVGQALAVLHPRAIIPVIHPEAPPRRGEPLLCMGQGQCEFVAVHG